jgi:hypothetical protein
MIGSGIVPCPRPLPMGGLLRPNSRFPPVRPVLFAPWHDGNRGAFDYTVKDGMVVVADVPL